MTKTYETQTEKFFEEYSRNTRTALAWIYPTELRTILEKVVDLQVEAGKLITKSTTDAITKFAPANK